MAAPAQGLAHAQARRPFGGAVADLLVAVPLAPQVGVQGHLAEALDRIRQAALEGQAAHLAVGHHIQPGLLLQGHGGVHRRVLDPLELGRLELALLEPLPGVEQRLRAEQAADHVGVGGDHGGAV